MSKPSPRPLRPHLDNIRGQGDRISSAADVALLQEAESDSPYVDRLYGHTWGFTPQLGAALYGKTERFAAAPFDSYADGRFLRVPFRRIPVIDVGSAQQLALIASQMISLDDSIQLRWRGQNQEFYLDRPEDDQLRLFGETGIKEPSLLPSAARSELEFAEVFTSWAAILDVYLNRFGSSPVAAAHLAPDQIRHELLSFRNGYQYRLWAFATAQHYGLPSVGLDVTTDLWTAVLFALHSFSTEKPSGATTIARVPDDAEPVLYALGGFQNDLFDDRDLAPTWLQCARPQRQSAHFFATGWGLSPNKAAERIFLAFRLKNHAQWKLPKPVEDLFPLKGEDSFLDFLLNARRDFPEIAEAAGLHRIYYLR